MNLLINTLAITLDSLFSILPYHFNEEIKIYLVFR